MSVTGIRIFCSLSGMKVFVHLKSQSFTKNLCSSITMINGWNLAMEQIKLERIRVSRVPNKYNKIPNESLFFLVCFHHHSYEAVTRHGFCSFLFLTLKKRRMNWLFWSLLLLLFLFSLVFIFEKVHFSMILFNRFKISFNYLNIFK